MLYLLAENKVKSFLKADKKFVLLTGFPSPQPFFFGFLLLDRFLIFFFKYICLPSYLALSQYGLVSAFVKHMALWLYGLVSVWPYGCMALWLYGLVSVWPCDFMALWHMALWHMALWHMALWHMALCL